MGSDYLAIIDTYPLPQKNASSDINSEIDLLWGDFQNYVLSDDIMP